MRFFALFAVVYGIRPQGNQLRYAQEAPQFQMMNDKELNFALATQLSASIQASDKSKTRKFLSDPIVAACFFLNEKHSHLNRAFKECGVYISGVLSGELADVGDRVSGTKCGPALLARIGQLERFLTHPTPVQKDWMYIHAQIEDINYFASVCDDEISRLECTEASKRYGLVLVCLQRFRDGPSGLLGLLVDAKEKMRADAIGEQAKIAFTQIIMPAYNEDLVREFAQRDIKAIAHGSRLH